MDDHERGTPYGVMDFVNIHSRTGFLYIDAAPRH